MRTLMMAVVVSVVSFLSQSSSWSAAGAGTTAPTAMNITRVVGTVCLDGASYTVTRSCSTVGTRMVGLEGSCWDTYTANNQSCGCGGDSGAGQSCMN